MNSESNIEPRSFSKRDKGIFYIGLSLIAILEFTLSSFEIEKVPPIGAIILLIIDIIVFSLVLKKTKFNKIFLLQCVLVVCYFWLFFFILSITGKSSELLSEMGKVLTANLLLSVTSLALSAGVLEEIFFRKILFDIFRKGVSPRWAIFWTSFIFFFMHPSLNPILFLIGVMFANLALRFKSLIAVISMHAFYDFIGYLSKIKALQSGHFENSFTASDWLRGGNSLTEMTFFGLFVFYMLTRWAWHKLTTRDVETLEVPK